MTSISELLQTLGLPHEEVAARSRLPINRVRELAEGITPSMADLRALSRGLRLPMQALAAGRPPSSGGSELSFQFRTVPRHVPDQHEPTYESVAAFVEAALKILPRRETPYWIKRFGGPIEENRENAEALAMRFREAITPGDQSSPLINLPQVIEQLDGALVSQLRHSKYEGVSLVSGGYIFIFVSPRFSGRMLFTLAHELGHALAHHSLEAPLFERPRDIGRGHSRSERFVDAFASALLLPARGVGEALSVIRDLFQIDADEIGDIEILFISRFFGVSFETAALRCERLDLLPRGGAASLVEFIRKNHKTPERRADAVGLPPRREPSIPQVSPTLLRAAFDQINAGGISPSWIADRFQLSVEQLYFHHARLSAERADNS